MTAIKRALISVSDKEGIVAFAKQLSEMGVEIISTGGTAKVLKESGIPIIYISDFTGSPEILEGRLKTLHPKVHGGLLAKRDNAQHQKEMQENDILPIDMVVVNLYPFAEVYLKENASPEEIIENIDIGGPTMLRSAAKNYKDVAVVVNPKRYNEIIEQMKHNKGNLDSSLHQELAKEVFETTAQYDTLIAEYFNSISEAKSFPENFNLSFTKVQDLRYGENPHQSAAFYREQKITEPSIATAKQLHGKELSYNNIMDLDAALEIIKDFDEPACAIIKHTNPCGAAESKSIFTAYEKALSCDPVSAFGSIVSFNQIVEKNTAEALAKNFVEAVIAPGFEKEAMDILQKKKNIRLLEIPELTAWLSHRTRSSHYDLKKIAGGILIQQNNYSLIDPSQLKVVSNRKPTHEEFLDLLFAWKIVKHVKSNAIVYAKNSETVGIGAGQMSRVDSSKLAVMKAQKELKGSVLASDAFFPFRDGVDAAFKAGTTAVIQPGGSMRDEEVIAACNEHDMAMVFTGIRHFKH